MGRVLALGELPKALSPLRPQKKLVFTNGCFDLLHVGHVRYLQEARRLGDILLIAINTDASVKALKGPDRPIQTEMDRAEILASLECVDFVTFFSDPTPIKVIELVKPDILVKGGDWPVEKIVGSDLVLKSGGTVRSLAFHPGRSSSEIIKKIQTL